MQSLQAKLSAGLFLSLLLTFSALWLLVSFNVQYLAEEYIASRLKHDADTLLSSISFDQNNQLVIDSSRVDLIYSQPFSGHYYVIDTSKQSVTSRSLWDQVIKHKTVDTGQQLKSIQQGPEKQSLLLISAGYKKQGHHLTVTVAEDLNPINKNIIEFKTGFAVVAIGLLLVLLVFQIIILRVSLRPLNKTKNELQDLQQGRLEKLSTDAPDELKPLIFEVNHLLDIMQKNLLRSRNALGDLAHSIKKPLTVMKQITSKIETSDTNRVTLDKQCDDIHQITDRILKRARLAGHSHSGSLFSFSEDFPVLLKTLNMMHVNNEIQLNTQLPDNLICPVDREDMLELLGNILDNAYKWAAHEITVKVTSDPELHIVIEDDGPGADNEKLSELSKRGVRLDEKVQGHGFGLAISADIVADYNGKMSFNHSADLGGFRVDITLPLH